MPRIKSCDTFLERESYAILYISVNFSFYLRNFYEVLIIFKKFLNYYCLHF